MADRPCFQIKHNGTWYTLGELQKVLEPVYREYEARIQSCISGLTQYAEGLAATGEEARLPALRRLVTEMAEFWDLELREKYGGAFDRAVTAGRASGRPPVLSAEAQGDILSGLALYAREMTACGGLDRWVRQCDDLAEQLAAEWFKPEPWMGGMNFE